MTRDRKSHLITVAILIAAAGFGLIRLKPFRGAPPSPEPQDAIYSMLNAARTGDVKAYLASYTGQMQASLRQELAETNETAFAKYLRDSNAAIKGVSVSEPLKISDVDAKVRVEYVYADRNEAQTMSLRHGPNGWKISGADSDERVKTLIPYGTPVR